MSLYCLKQIRRIATKRRENVWLPKRHDFDVSELVYWPGREGLWRIQSITGTTLKEAWCALWSPDGELFGMVPVRDLKRPKSPHD